MELKSSSADSVIIYRVFIGEDITVLSDKRMTQEQCDSAVPVANVTNNNCSVIDMRGDLPLLCKLQSIEEPLRSSILATLFVKLKDLTKSDRIMYVSNVSAF